jgi:predicted aldo/keto reductase-like oxidoreductase
MKVYHGGTLLSIKGRSTGITPAQCMDYVLSLDQVSTVVPGPKTLAEWQATLGYLTATAAERDFRPVLAGLPERLAGQCVYCHHCLPCPQGIEIGWALWLLDQAWTGLTPELQASYDRFSVKASACNQCGDCLSRCAFGVDILGKLAEAANLFERRA